MNPGLQALISFTVAAGLLTVTPGLDTAMILRTATVKKPEYALLVALGISVGCMSWCIITAFGLGALLLLSSSLYGLLRLLGACYLLYLGLKMILQANKQDFNETLAMAESKTGQNNDKRAIGWFSQGFLTNILNPKVGVFYITFMPQFIPKGQNVTLFSTLLGSIHALESALWAGLLILATKPLANWLKKPHISRNLDRVTGSVLLLFGFKLALEQKHA